jgi:F420H(2)-dependent quinone reductase
MKSVFKYMMQAMVFLYRLTKGGFGGRMANLNVLLLTTTGRKSGKTRTTPLGYFEHDGGYVIIGSNAGFETHPAWFYNLKTNPHVQIEIKDRKLTADAEVIPSEERSQLWARLVAMSPQYGEYERKTTREIPLVLLRPQPA